MEESQDKGFTLTITGAGPWERRASAAQANRMAIYVNLVEQRGGQGRCGTCAFRSGTDANGSSLVVQCVDHVLQTDGSFGCHSVPEDEPRECAGFAILRQCITRAP